MSESECCVCAFVCVLLLMTESSKVEGTVLAKQARANDLLGLCVETS